MPTNLWQPKPPLPPKGSVFWEIQEAIRRKTKMGITFPWSSVMNGTPYLFEQGLDFSCSAQRFQAYCHVRAKQQGQRVETKKIDETRVTATFYGKRKAEKHGPRPKRKKRKSPKMDDVKCDTEKV